MKVGATIRVGYEEIRPTQLKKLKKDLTFLNGKSQIVTNYRDVISRGYIRIPRGAWYLVGDLDYSDSRPCPKMPKLDFKIKLDDVRKSERFKGQSAAVAAMFEHEQGQIIRPPGTGKTQIALAFIASCKTRTLVLVHTKDILKQWKDYAEKAIPGIEIGVIQGKNDQVGHLTIATVQTIKKYVSSDRADKKFWRQFGCLIVDEGHHGAAKTWERIINVSPARYRFSFTASATRADGMHPALKYLFGPVIHKQKFSSPIPLKVVPVRTKFYFAFRGPFDWSRMVDEIVTNKARNKQIARVADAEIAKGNSILILSRRIEHLERIAAHITNGSAILTGAKKDSERSRILDGLREGTIACVLSTQLADEALDVPRLNRIVLTFPGKHEGRLIQQIGRELREFRGKEDAICYDIVDWRVGVLRRQWSLRRKAYRQNNISIKGGRSIWRKRK